MPEQEVLTIRSLEELKRIIENMTGQTVLRIVEVVEDEAEGE